MQWNACITLMKKLTTFNFLQLGVFIISIDFQWLVLLESVLRFPDFCIAEANYLSFIAIQLTDYHMMHNLQSVTKIVKLPLAPSASLFKVSFTFACSFLATTAWYSFSRLGATLKQGEVEAFLWANMTFLELFHKNMVSLNYICDWLSQNWSIWPLIESWRSIWQTFC